MQQNQHDEMEKLKSDCLALEEQVKILVKTEIQLRRTKAELIQSNQKIEDNNRTLEQKVEERTKELVIINEKLKREMVEREKAEIEIKKMENSLKRAERMEALGVLAGSVAHDLNNLLFGIIGYPELLLRKISKNSPLRQYIIDIKDSGEKAAAVVQDLMTLARREIINTELINLNDTLRMIMSSPEFLKLKKQSPGIRVKKGLQSNLFNMYSSPIHVYRAIMNLIINAFEAMETGGLLTISTESVRLDQPKNSYELIEAGEYATVTIADTGIGIPQKHMNRIFEPFYTRKMMGKSGTGLGMAIVWGTMKDHKGFINVESEEGKGTSIVLYFPATREVKKEKRSEIRSEECRGNNEAVLIIDDVEIQRDICSQYLTELGYCPVSVASGEEAIEYLKDKKVDLLILDMLLDPGMNGLETYKKIIEMHPGQRAVITSGFSESELVKQAQALGAGAYVKKPYSFETIGLVIKETLQCKK